MTNVDLGYSESCESWKLESKFFPSKIGGKPAWLDLENVPSGEDLSCSNCGEPMTFLCQVYAPYEDDDNNFHRTLFVFVCRKQECSERGKTFGLRVFRSNLGRENKYYSFDPPIEERDSSFSLSNWLSLCEVCGCMGSKKCSKCNLVSYCSRQHQIIDWREKHKSICGKNEKTPYTKVSEYLYPESEIIIEPEEWDREEVDEEEESKKYLDLVKTGNAGTMIEANEEDLNQYAVEDPDKTFTKFRKRVDGSPDQILRYERGGEPLLISDQEIPTPIPNCQYCEAPRQFEFQIMPQMLSVIKEQNIDWGILICYTCKNSCQNGTNYKEEFIFKQDVSAVDMKF